MTQRLIDNHTLGERIRKELSSLQSNLGSNSHGVKNIVSLFINETPGQIEEMAKSIENKAWSELSKLIHKIKIRYEYFGLIEIVSVLMIWERDLIENAEAVNNIEVIEFLKHQTEEAIAELKQYEYYQNKNTTGPGGMPLTGKLVLIAEDDEINAMVFDLFLKELGITTVVAVDGLQALKLAGEKTPDLILMDVHMPFYSGLDVIRDLRKVGYTSPIISLSASTRLNERQNSLDAGANDFLIKPANRESINKILMKYLS